VTRSETFLDRGGKWRWRLIAANGRRVATSGESFRDRWNAERALSDLLLGIAPLVDAERERQRVDAEAVPV
jgi:uncharacterized protein YegP (UPF0339 family)